MASPARSREAGLDTVVHTEIVLLSILVPIFPCGWTATRKGKVKVLPTSHFPLPTSPFPPPPPPARGFDSGTTRDGDKPTRRLLGHLRPGRARLHQTVWGRSVRSLDTARYRRAPRIQGFPCVPWRAWRTEQIRRTARAGLELDWTW